MDKHEENRYLVIERANMFCEDGEFDHGPRTCSDATAKCQSRLLKVCYVLKNSFFLFLSFDR